MMTRLVRLYPRPWRDRYEAELIDLLEQRPPSPGDAIDLIRGAVDAHIHPQAERPMPWTHRLPGVVALTTGLMWVSAIVIASSVDDWSATGTLIGLALMTMFISLPGDYLATYGRRIGVGFGVLALAFLVVNVTPWPVAAFVYGFAIVIFLVGSLTLAAIRAGVGASARWRVVGGAIAVPIAAVPILLYLTGSVDGTVARPFVLFAAPYGIAWALIGLLMLVRGSQTIVDSPSTEPQPALDTEIIG
jgi:hypothetical protein